MGDGFIMPGARFREGESFEEGQGILPMIEIRINGVPYTRLPGQSDGRTPEMRRSFFDGSSQGQNY